MTQLTPPAQLKYPGMYGPPFSWGCDPEGFFYKGEEPVSSGEVLALHRQKTFRLGSVHRDGFQFELHTNAVTSPRELCTRVASCVKETATYTAAFGVTPKFTRALELSPATMKTLDAAARELGCDISENFYGLSPQDQPSETYLIRSGGGHLHLGIKRPLYHKRVDLVPYLDTILGNTCVLLDQDPGSALRRRLYGLPGEFRTPRYGLEYRTLSNFWLENETVMRTTLGIAELAVAAFVLGTQDSAFEDTFTSAVDIERVQQAILTNDVALARQTLEGAVVPMLEQRMPDTGFMLTPGDIKILVKTPEKLMGV